MLGGMRGETGLMKLWGAGRAPGGGCAAAARRVRDVMLCYRMHYSAGGESGNLRQYPLIRRIADYWAADEP